MSQQTQQPAQSQPPVSTDGQLYPTRSYQSPETRARTVADLDQVLADTIDLASQARFAHWNVRGMNFYQLHELFEDLYEELADQADDIAERAASLGGQATGTARAAAAISRIPEIQPDAVTGPDCVDQLVERLAIHDANLYEAIQAAADRGDLDTADLLNEVSREVGRYRWFLEAHLETQPVGGAGGRRPGQTPQAATQEPQPGTGAGQAQRGPQAQPSTQRPAGTETPQAHEPGRGAAPEQFAQQPRPAQEPSERPPSGARHTATASTGTTGSQIQQSPGQGPTQ